MKRLLLIMALLFTTLFSDTINFKQGWNFIGLNNTINLSNDATFSDSSKVKLIWKYINDPKMSLKGWSIYTSDNSLKAVAQNKGITYTNTLLYYEGAWVYAKKDFNYTPALKNNTFTNDDLPYGQGWSLLSAADNANISLSDKIFINSELVAVYRNSEWYVKTDTNNTKYKVLSTINPYEAFWVYNDVNTTISGQATLGPLSGSDIVLMDLNNTMIASSTAKSDDTDLNIAGSFSFSVKKSKLPDTFLLVAGGGKDIDPSDDGAMSNSVDNNGSIHTILTIDDLQLKGLKINPLTEVVYQDALNTYGNGLASLSKSDLKVFLDKEAKTYLTDANATYSDILTFNPRVDKAKSKIAWSKVLSLVVSGVHDGESTGTINQRVASLKAWLKNKGVYTNNKNTSIEQISSNGNGNRIVTTMTKGEDNSSIGTINQILTTSSGEIINIYASKVNDTESYLRATVTKQGHEFSIEGKTTLLQGLSFDANTISNFVGSLITVTDSNATTIQITIDKQLTNKISDHEVVLKIDGREPTADELQVITDDPVTKWNYIATKNLNAFLYSTTFLYNKKNTKVEILKNGTIVIEIDKNDYDKILKINTKGTHSFIETASSDIIAKVIEEFLRTGTKLALHTYAKPIAFILDAYSAEGDLSFLVNSSADFLEENIISSRVELVGKYKNNDIIIGNNYIPIIYVRGGDYLPGFPPLPADEQTTVKLFLQQGYVWKTNSPYKTNKEIDRKLYSTPIGTFGIKKNKGYIIVPNLKLNFFNPWPDIYSSKLAKYFKDYVQVDIHTSGKLTMAARNSSFILDNSQTIYTDFTYSTTNNQLSLDAKSSIAPDGDITNYTWKNALGTTIATGETPYPVRFSDLIVNNGLTSITLETKSAGYTGTKTEMISLCGANEIYKNGTCVSTTTKPILIITDTQSGTATTTDPITFTFTWSEDVSGFNSSDIIVNGGTKGTFTAVSDSVYTLVVTPNSNSTNPITIDIPANSVTNTFQNTNDAIAQYIQDKHIPKIEKISCINWKNSNGVDMIKYRDDGVCEFAYVHANVSYNNVFRGILEDGNTVDLPNGAKYNISTNIIGLNSTNGTLDLLKFKTGTATLNVVLPDGNSYSIGIEVKHKKLPVSITIEGPTEVNENSSTQYTAKLHYDDGTTQILSGGWSFNTNKAGTIDNNSGILVTKDINSDENIVIEIGAYGLYAHLNVTVKDTSEGSSNYPTTNIKDYLIFDGEHGFWQLRLDSDNSKVSIIRINNETFDNNGYISANNIFYDDFHRVSTGLEIVNIDNKSFTLKYFDTLDKTTVLKQTCNILSNSSFKCEDGTTFYKSNSQEYEDAVANSLN